VLGKIAKLPEGTPVATDIADRVGITAKHRELNIHRVILRH
jgi:GTP-sensing pleiotropic transcriptional regulator CodY